MTIGLRMTVRTYQAEETGDFGSQWQTASTMIAVIDERAVFSRR